MPTFKLALRMLARERRAGDLWVLLLALTVAVAALSTTRFLFDRVAIAMEREAGDLIASDLSLVSDHRIDAVFEIQARRLGLRIATTTIFPSMIVAGDRTALAEIKAVSSGYPLRGALVLAPALKPSDGEGGVWMDQRLLLALGLQPGSVVSVGESSFQVRGEVRAEPDRGGDFFRIAPRLLMREADLGPTGLLQPQSRVVRRLLVSGEPTAVARFKQWASSRLERGQRLESARDARPELKVALERGERFLSLASLVTVALAGIAIALAIRRYLNRHIDASALMRCLGAPDHTIFRLFLYQLLLLAGLASTIGAATGWIAQAILANYLSGLFENALPAPHALTIFEAPLVAAGMLAIFAVPALLRLRRVPAGRVLRGDARGPSAIRAFHFLFAFAVLAALLLWQAADIKLGLYLLIGLTLSFGASALASYVLIAAVKRLNQAGGIWRYGVARLARGSGETLAQLSGFTLAIMVLLVLTVVRNDVLSAWQQTLPADAPNRFVINVQPDQLDAVRTFLARELKTPVTLHAMIRARLVSINAHPIASSAYSDARARRLVEREFNLSPAGALTPDNKLIEGRWWRPGDRGFSVEEGIAKTLGIKLGDRLGYDVAGSIVEAPVLSIRKVKWDSFQVNFFVVASPHLLDGLPSTYISSFYLDPQNDRLITELTRAFPNLTVIDVAAIMAQVRATGERLAKAIQFVFLFTLASGLAVFYAAIVSTWDERLFESAVLRTLGATSRQLAASHFAEFALMGSIAGLLGASGASAIAYWLSVKVFDIPFHFDLAVLGWSAGGGAIFVAVLGTLGVARIANSSPSTIFRRASTS